MCDVFYSYIDWGHLAVIMEKYIVDLNLLIKYNWTVYSSTKFRLEVNLKQINDWFTALPSYWQYLHKVVECLKKPVIASIDRVTAQEWRNVALQGLAAGLARPSTPPAVVLLAYMGQPHGRTTHQQRLLRMHTQRYRRCVVYDLGGWWPVSSSQLTLH